MVITDRLEVEIDPPNILGSFRLLSPTWSHLSPGIASAGDYEKKTAGRGSGGIKWGHLLTSPFIGYLAVRAAAPNRLFWNGPVALMSIEVV